MFETIRKSYHKLFYSKFSMRIVNNVNVSLEDLHGNFKSLARIDHTALSNDIFEDEKANF